MFINPEFVQETQQIGTIVQSADVYRNYPTYQRRYRAPMRYRQRLIDSILRGYPIPALMAYREIGKDGVQRYQIIDGKQRLETIYEYVAGEFITSSLSFDGVKPLYPRKLYRDLPAEAHNRFRTYLLRFQVWLNVDASVHDDVFRRIGEALPLTSAEKIMTHDSESNARAERIARHPWLMRHLSPSMIDKSMGHYVGLCLLMLHINDDRCYGLHAQVVQNLARGESEMAHALTQRIDLSACERRSLATLDTLQRLAASMGYVNLSDITALVIAVGVLDAFNTSAVAPDDCLSSWLPITRDITNNTRLFGVHGSDRSPPWGRLAGTATNQRAFRDRFIPSLIDIATQRRAAAD